METLTQREEEVLRLIGDGIAVKKIAASLLISKYGVYFHCNNLKRKLDCRTQGDLVIEAVRRRLYANIPAEISKNCSGHDAGSSVQ